MKTFTRLMIAGAVLGASGLVHAGATLDAIHKKGFIQCGVSDGIPGFSVPDKNGKQQGIDVDVCHAVAAAVFGDAGKVRFTPTNGKERLAALQSGEIDILSRSTTWTSSRDAGMGLVFTGVTYYDGAGFMVNKKLGVSSATELDGASICIQAGTTTELNTSDFFRSRGLKFTPITFDTSEETAKALQAGRCDVITADKSQLNAQRSQMTTPSDFVILPETISKEPMGPSVRRGDDEWFSIVRWTLFAMLNAEEAGVTSANVEAQAKTTRNPDVARLLGADGEYGKDLKLPRDWVVQVVKQVGSYGEVFNRAFGPETPLAIDRGLNNLWNNGGIQYAPPVR
ncbi:amino acid ABC transporter substrate-binding protein [Pseudomonas sp. B6002]|uniref:amino acid ABC transporter substrate-binding protein n=1 Tax=Pseudomonas sp. B6002 TaxID=2726978 RepID=UPI0015A313AC|nr:amino acid ABC transporter substrate-binding protein [Pseudomonas sp. B6002]NVZ51302.1 amino acid ABC transporter substrate-binding protein [Pseudomonas sp. B6002]